MIRLRIFFVPALICVALAVTVTLIMCSPRSSGSLSVILVSVDTLRPDHLGCYGYGQNTSPAVDAFALDALLFERCFAQAPTTRPSCASFLSGFFPHECKVATNVANLPPEVVTIAERLKDAGFRTMAVSSNFVLGPASGFEQGFDVFDNNLEEMELVRRVPERIAARTTDAAIGLLEGAGERFFLWVHYQDPHGPYTPPPPFDAAFPDVGREPRNLPLNITESGIAGIPRYQQQPGHEDYDFYVARYDGEIAYMDVHVARLLQALKDRELYDKSLIIFTSDHGEGMGERDYFFAHGEFVYNNLARVPLVVKAPGIVPGRSSEYVQLLDIVPTILSYAGRKPDPNLRGRNLLGASLSPTPILCEMQDKYSLIQDGVKVIAHIEEREFMVFDLAEDLAEEHNLITEPKYEQMVMPTLEKVDSLLAEDRIAGAVARPADLSDEDREKLKSLGYTH